MSRSVQILSVKEFGLLTIIESHDNVDNGSFPLIIISPIFFHDGQNHVHGWWSLWKYDPCFTLLRPFKHRVGNKFILDDVSGCAKPGSLLGILGASGAGKSTLLDIISSRAAEKSYTGSSFVDCKKMDSQTLRHISGYVMQDDALLPTLSVWETLKYAYEHRVSHEQVFQPNILYKSYSPISSTWR